MANERKSKKLGIPFGTANARLRKSILFHFVKKAQENFCYRCGKEIQTEEEFSIEHKVNWMNNEVSLFWSIDNIAFSHLICNLKAKKNRIRHHGKRCTYSSGCRCELCTEANTIEKRKTRANNKAEVT